MDGRLARWMDGWMGGYCLPWSSSVEQLLPLVENFFCLASLLVCVVETSPSFAGYVFMYMCALVYVCKSYNAYIH